MDESPKVRTITRLYSHKGAIIPPGWTGTIISRHKNINNKEMLVIVLDETGQELTTNCDEVELV